MILVIIFIFGAPTKDLVSMKSKYQKNTNKTSSEPQYNIGDLVCHRYPDLRANPKDIGLVVDVHGDMCYSIDEGDLINVIYAYLIEWASDGSRSYLYEMFVKNYVPPKMNISFKLANLFTIHHSLMVRAAGTCLVI